MQRSPSSAARDGDNPRRAVCPILVTLSLFRAHILLGMKEEYSDRNMYLRPEECKKANSCGEEGVDLGEVGRGALWPQDLELE